MCICDYLNWFLEDSLTQTPSITIANGSDNDRTMYFKVEYSTDNVSWTNYLSDESVTVGTSSTHSAPAISNGTTIHWRYSIMNNWRFS